MGFLKYLIIFLVVFIIIYLLYFFVIVKPELKKKKNKNNEKKISKKKEEKIKQTNKTLRELTGINILIGYYHIDIDKVGKIRTLRLLNFVNAFMLSLLVMIVFPINAIWLKLFILAIVILPCIWFTYYFLAKYLKYLEGKSE